MVLLKIFIYGSFALCGIPFVITWLLSDSGHSWNKPEETKKKRIAAFVLNLTGNALLLSVAVSLFFQTWKIWRPLKKILLIQASWQELLIFSLITAICSCAGILVGVALRMLLFRKDSFEISPRRKAFAMLLCVLCLSMTCITYGLERDNARKVYIAEVCRDTSVYYVNPNGREDIGDSDREISYVLLRNPGLLDCYYEKLYLSEAEDDLTALEFSDITVPANGESRLVMDYTHGLDLNKNDWTTIWVSEGKDESFEEIRVPALKKDEVYRFFADSGTWRSESFIKYDSRELEKPVFSRAGGFYDESFELTLSGPEGTEIYYTLNCANPKEQGILYTGPIQIEDPSKEENVWSARTDVSAAFVTDEPERTAPDEPVDKCMVVRAICRDSEGKTSPVATESYFINYQGREGYEGIGVVSLVSDPDNLFDKDKGIYVLGRIFEEQHGTEREGLGWWWWPANYHQKGRYWEREAFVQFFDNGQNPQFSGPVGLRIKGGASAGKVPKGLNLFTREEYGSSRFEADLFGNGYYPRRISLSAGGNDVELKVRDWLTTRLAGHLGIVMNKNIPYCLFLDGEYWGNYWLIEQYDDEYFAHYAKVSRENVVVVKNGSLKVGEPEDKALLDRMKKYISTEDMSLESNYEKACEMVDMDDFLNYYALEMYITNHDWGLNKNAAHWRTRMEESTPLGDARWRKAVFDTNSYSCYGDAESDSLDYMMNQDKVFASLMKNQEFRNGFYSKLLYLAEDIFSPVKANEALDEFTALMEKPLALEYKRFNLGSDTLKKLDRIRAFIRDRQTYILRLCDEYFGKQTRSD